MAQVQFHGLSELDRFHKWFTHGAIDECWPWRGSRKSSGSPPTPWHGQWRASDGSIELAHRAAWRLLRAPIPPKACVLHSCDNPICVNPAHLFLGTQSDNLKDMWRKGRGNPGISCGEAHGGAKITADLVRDIRRSVESGVELARRLGLTPATICDIRKRRTWKHIA